MPTVTADQIIKEIEEWKDGVQMKARFEDDATTFIEFVVEPAGRERLEALCSGTAKGTDDEPEDNDDDDDDDNDKKPGVARSGVARTAQRGKR